MSSMPYYSLIPSHLGNITIQCNDNALLGIWFETHTTKPASLGIKADAHPLLTEAQQQLQQYFTGTRQQFSLPFELHGTEFQKQVWCALTKIPFGYTASYQDLAIAIGRPKAVRAVGATNGKNPLSIVIPCHRVIGANGKLTGYAGGIERKQQLLELEGVI